MSLNFNEISFEELKASSKSAFSMGPFGSKIKAENFVKKGVPVIKGGNLNGDLNDSSFDFLTLEKAQELSSSIARSFDIVITHRGTLGQVGIIPEASRYPEYIVSQSQLKLTFDQTKVNPYFIYYFLRSSIGQKRLLANTSQVGVPAIAQALTSIRNIKIPLPSLFEQNEIVKLLRLLDDRIALLRQTNSTLESIAQVLFKSWFIDFDPVHAKAEGREPEGMDAETATLFSDSFEESELGMIPNGWHVSSLDKAYEINPIRKLKKGEIAPYLDMAHTPTKGHHAFMISLREMKAGTKFINGDTLLARITPCLENGKTTFVDFLNDNQIGWGSTEFVVLRPRAPLPLYHGYLLTRYSPFRKFAIQSMSGTSGRQRIQISTFSRYLITIPTNGVLEVFGNIASLLQQKITTNSNQIKTLELQRDTLLPHLIAGKLILKKVPEMV